MLSIYPLILVSLIFYLFTHLPIYTLWPASPYPNVKLQHSTAQIDDFHWTGDVPQGAAHYFLTTYLCANLTELKPPEALDVQGSTIWYHRRSSNIIQEVSKIP